MNRKVIVAAVQMEIKPAPTAERLARAEALVQATSEAGAQLVVLPELFNTGYAYVAENYRRAEPMAGPTATWMKRTAARMDLHLAGTLLLLDEREIYNAMLLVAPDGRIWRYDKAYPWGWERGYFRGRSRVTVAQTDLGDFGMLICWDVAHPGLWRRYAGRVDMIVVCSSPPDVPNAIYAFPGGPEVATDRMGPLMSAVRDQGRKVFCDTIADQAAWLGVPAVSSAGTGTFESRMPAARGSLAAILPTAPHLARHLPHADDAILRCAMVPACRILNAGGQILATQPQAAGESFALAQVTLPAGKTRPRDPQPRAQASLPAYLISDVVLPALTEPTYRRDARRAWGRSMAPAEIPTWKGLALLLLGLLIGRLWKRAGSSGREA